MSVQHERLGELCGELRLGAIANQYSALAQQAAERHSSFSDFREALIYREENTPPATDAAVARS